MVRELFPLAAFAVTALLTATAGAQVTICGDRDAIAGKLAADYSERQAALGLAADGRLVEVFASPTGTWTLLLTRPDGQACVVIHGESWTPTPVHTVKPVT